MIEQKALDADPRTIQQIIFTGKIRSTVSNTRVIIYYILEQSKEKTPQFSKLTNNARTTLRMSLKMFDGNDLPHELLLTTRQKTARRNAFNKNMSTDIKLSKAQIPEIIQSGEFLGSLLSKLSGPLMKVTVPLAKNILATLEITAAASAIDAGIQKKIHGSGTKTLIISNKHMNEIIKIVQALEDSNILLKRVTKTIKKETKEQKGGFLSMLSGTLGASLLGDLLSRKGIARAGSGNNKGKGIVRAGYGNEMDF